MKKKAMFIKNENKYKFNAKPYLTQLIDTK